MPRTSCSALVDAVWLVLQVSPSFRVHNYALVLHDKIESLLLQVLQLKLLCEMQDVRGLIRCETGAQSIATHKS